MSSHYSKPENALRKANDLLSVNKPLAALNVLHQMLSSKRNRLWSPTHEQIMFSYIELSVQQKLSIKETLIQYRLLCTSNYASSFEKCCKYYIELAKKKCHEAELFAKEKFGREISSLIDTSDETDLDLDDEEGYGGYSVTPESICETAFSSKIKTNDDVHYQQ